MNEAYSNGSEELLESGPRNQADEGYRGSVEIYSWAGNGNLGDDWIAQVASKRFPHAVFVREKFCPYPLHWGRRCLTNSHSKGKRPPLILWGGGWLASDQSEYNTVKRWKRHFEQAQSSGQEVFAFGIGLGPFNYFLKDSKKVLKFLAGRIWVRTDTDLRQISSKSAYLASDCTLLDALPAATEGPEEWDYVIDFPPWSEHWLESRPWLTLEHYRKSILDLVGSIPPNSRVAFLEAVRDDVIPWQELGLPVLSPRSVDELIAAIQKSKIVISGRLHPAILGALLGKRVLPVAYHHKFQLLSELGLTVLGLEKEFSVANALEKASCADQKRVQDVRHRVSEKFRELIQQLTDKN